MNALAIPEFARDVTVLFVDRDGIYPSLVADTWDAARDARLYDGPNPVVAHPPCQLWVNLAHVNYKRYGGGHNRPGNDGGCFASALYNVRRWGGVLEHPADSNAWAGARAHASRRDDRVASDGALRVGLRDPSERVRTPRTQANVAFLLRTRPPARGAMGSDPWDASGGLVRPEQADAIEEGCECDAARLC